jgi:hypothetical protein
MRGFFAALRMTSSFWSGFGSRTAKARAKAKTTAKAKANAGVLRFAQNDRAFVVLIVNVTAFEVGRWKKEAGLVARPALQQVEGQTALGRVLGSSLLG